MFHIKKKSMKYSWFISYMLILIVPVVMCFLLCFQMQQRINQERMAKIELQMDNILTNAQADVEKGEDIANVFKNTELVHKINLINDYDKEEDANLFMQLSAEIANYKAQFSVKENIYIYFGRTDLIIDSEGYKIPMNFYEKNYSLISGLSYSNWKNAILSAGRQHKMINLYSKSDNEKVFQNTLHIVGASELGEPSCAIMIQGIVDFSNGSYPRNDFRYAIFEPEGSPVYFSEGFGSKKLLLLKDSIDVTNIDGKKYIVYKKKYETNSYTYIFALDYYEALKNTGIYVYIFLVLISAVLSFWLLWNTIRRNYTFVDKIVERFKKKKENQNMGKNEIDFIMNMISKIDGENDYYNRLIAEQNTQLKSSNLSRILRGTDNKIQAIQDGILVANNIEFLSDYFAVAVFLVEDYVEFFSDYDDMNEQERINVVKYAIKNIAEEMVLTYGNTGYTADMEEISTLIVSFAPANVDKADGQLKILCESLAVFMKEKMGVTISASVSHIHKSIFGISVAYKEAMKTLEYKFVLGEGNVITPEDIEYGFGGSYFYTQDREQSMLSFIRTGNKKQAVALLDKIFEETEKSVANILKIRCMCFDIIATILKLINEVKQLNFEFDENAVIDEIISQKSVESVKSTIITLIDKLCGHFENESSESLEKRVEKLLEKYYADMDLSVYFISEKLRMHHTYLSNIFKAQVGIGLLEYINRFRIKKACLLFNKIDINVSDVSERVGYQSSKTFARIFKQYTGMTPTQYRTNSMTEN